MVLDGSNFRTVVRGVEWCFLSILWVILVANSCVFWFKNGFEHCFSIKFDGLRCLNHLWMSALNRDQCLTDSSLSICFLVFKISLPYLFYGLSNLRFLFSNLEFNRILSLANIWSKDDCKCRHCFVVYFREYPFLLKYVKTDFWLKQIFLIITFVF